MKKKKQKFFEKYKTAIYLTAIILVAIIFRFAFLTTIPNGIHPDSATNAIDSYRALESGQSEVFYENNFGREGLYFNIISFFYAVFGVNYFVFKTVGALIGVLSVLGMYFLGKEVAKDKLVGLLSAFFMAVSFWMVLFDRMGFRAVLSVFAVTWTLYFFARALRTGGWYDYIFSGIFLGIGMHSYIAFRAMPLVLVLAMLYKVYLEKRNKRGKFSWKKTLRPYLNFIWTILISLLITAPLLWYFYTNPGTFFGRTSEISVFQQESTFRLMATSIGAALGMYNFYGDPNWRHNVSGDPALMFAEGALFLIGIVLVIRYLLIKQRAAKDVVQFKTNYILLLALFVVMILPAGLSYSPGGIPHALRTLNTAPAVFVFAALAAALIYYKALPKIKDKKKTTFAISILILTSIAAGNFNKYFYQWGMNKNVKYEYHEDYANLSKFINANAAQGAEVLIVDNSVEVEFFTLERKNVLRVSQFDWQTLVGIRPDLLAFSNFGQFNENNYIRRGLQFSGWKEMEGLNFGEGSGDIKVFTKDEISNF